MSLLVGPERPAAEPWAYFITFACYGTRSHGDECGSVDRRHNGWRTPYLSDNPDRLRYERKRMGRDAVTLCAAARDIVLATILSVSRHERWTVYAAHVRSTLVHVVVSAPVKPEAVMGKLKAYSSRALNRSVGTETKRWSRHGSTVYLWDVHLMRRAVDYVVRGQGPAMSCYANAEADA